VAADEIEQIVSGTGTRCFRKLARSFWQYGDCIKNTGEPGFNDIGLCYTSSI